MSTLKLKGKGPVILVDDDPVFHDIFGVFYQIYQLPNELISLKSGHECIDFLKSYNQDNIPAIILMDINMPGITGIETVKRIREIDDFVETPIVTMLTSSTDNEDVRSSLDAGANHYIAKPSSLAELSLECV